MAKTKKKQSIVKKEVFKETQKLIIHVERKKNTEIYYREHKENKDEGLVKIYEIQIGKGNIVYYLNGNKVDTLLFEGFKELPTIISEYGYGFRNNAINNFFRYKIETNGLPCIISNESCSSDEGDMLVFNINDLEDLDKSINQEQYSCNQIKNIIIGNFISDKLPSLNFDYHKTNSNKQLILRNLNDRLINQLNADEVEEFGRFYVKATEKYTRKDLKERMVLDLQEKARLLTLRAVIKEYEDLLKANPAESKWQAFFDKYITLFDNRYVKKIDIKNIAVGITKFPDLVLVDIYGYIDFYELKKSGVKLLAYDNSHKTYYWSPEISKTIAQVSVYLQKAKDNSLSYIKAVKEETETEDQDGLEVDIVRPKAIIVAGSSKELNKEKKREHFKNLRESLKDIEFVLYDELLERLNNLLNSITEGD